MTGREIEIRVNGRDRRVPAGWSVARLLEEIEVDGRAVVVERNRRIVRRDELEEVRLEEGDRLEIVHFVGGGGVRPGPPRRPG